MTRPGIDAPNSFSCAERQACGAARKAARAAGRAENALRGPSRPRARWRAGLVVLASTLLLEAGCEDPVTAVEIVEREHRFGIFRDLVLFKRPQSEGGPFFLDRFEATRADFAAFREVDEQNWYPDRRPQGNVDLTEARRFARWRFCRIPRVDEWRYACTRGGTYNFPWGDSFSDTKANTGRIGLGQTTEVGSFASGGASPIGPFDLVGNLAEWTETVADAKFEHPVPFRHVVTRDVPVERVVGLPEWPDFQSPEPNENPWEQLGALPLGLRVWLPLWAPLPAAWLEQGGFSDYTLSQLVERTDESFDMPGVFDFRRTPGLRCWLPEWSIAPTDWLIQAESEDLDRFVVGGHYRTRSFERTKDRADPSTLYWQPQRRDPTTGVRVASDPEDLLEALLAYDGPEPGEAAGNTLRRFLATTPHRETFLHVWPVVLRRSAGRGGVLRPLMIAELGNE